MSPLMKEIETAVYHKMKRQDGTFADMVLKHIPQIPPEKSIVTPKKDLSLLQEEYKKYGKFVGKSIKEKVNKEEKLSLSHDRIPSKVYFSPYE